MKILLFLALGLSLTACVPMNEKDREDLITYPYERHLNNPTNNAAEEGIETTLPDKQVLFNTVQIHSQRGKRYEISTDTSRSPLAHRPSHDRPFDHRIYNGRAYKTTSSI